MTIGPRQNVRLLAVPRAAHSFGHVSSWHRAGIFGTAATTTAIWWYNGPATECCWRTVPDPQPTSLSRADCGAAFPNQNSL